MKDPIRFAGFSRVDGSIKFRTARTASRVHQLKLQGEVSDIVEIAEAADRKSAAQALLAINHASDNAEVVALYKTIAGEAQPAKTVKVRVARKNVTATELLATAGLTPETAE